MVVCMMFFLVSFSLQVTQMSRPDLILFLMKYLMALVVGIPSVFWVGSKKTCFEWASFFHGRRKKEWVLRQTNQLSTDWSPPPLWSWQYFDECSVEARPGAGSRAEEDSTSNSFKNKALKNSHIFSHYFSLVPESNLHGSVSFQNENQVSVKYYSFSAVHRVVLNWGLSFVKVPI